MKTYLIWKRDSNAENRQSSIHLRQVEKDGVTFKNDRENVTLVTANFTTDRRVVEGPWMIYRYFCKDSSLSQKLPCLIICCIFDLSNISSIFEFQESRFTTCFTLVMVLIFSITM